MRRLLQLITCSAMLAAVGLSVSPTALAQGTSTSAGDQQYIDPLTTTTVAPPPPTSSSSTPPATTSTGTSSGSSQSSSATTATATTSSSQTSSPATTSTSSAGTADTTGTLPFTGLNVEAAVAVGLGLLGGGLLLRLTVRRA